MAYSDFRALAPVPMCIGATSMRSTETRIDADGEKVAVCGRVHIPDGTTRSIRRIHVLLADVSKTAGTAVQLSLQDVALTPSSGPAQPDETADQTVAIPNAALANGWYRSDALSADREVADGDRLAVVMEYTTFEATNVVALQGVLDGNNGVATMAIKTSGTWYKPANVYPNVLLEFTDGTFGTLYGCFVATEIPAWTLNSGSNPNEWALKFRFAANTVMAGVLIQQLYCYAGAEFEVRLYEGTTLRATVAFDAAEIGHANYFNYWAALRYTLTANTWYYLAIAPTNTNNIAVRYTSVNAAGHWAVNGGDADWCASSRNGAAWSDTAVSRPRFFIQTAQVEASAGGGGLPIFGGSIVR